MSAASASTRVAQYPIDAQFTKRWSPRALTGAPVSREALFVLFEAARWAPSSYNGQPWRFFYALRDTPAWGKFFDLLVPFNQAWCKNAGALVVMASKTVFEHNGQPSPTHSFDAGSAWMSLALQASLSGLVAHGMQGFDYEKAKVSLALPQDLQVEAMCAVGHQAPADTLPEDLRKNESPNSRKPVSEFAFEGGWRS